MYVEEIEDKFLRMVREILPPIHNQKLVMLCSTVNRISPYSFQAGISNIIRPIILYHINDLDERYKNEAYNVLSLMSDYSCIESWLELMEKIVLPFMKQSNILEFA